MKRFLKFWSPLLVLLCVPLAYNMYNIVGWIWSLVVNFDAEFHSNLERVAWYVFAGVLFTIIPGCMWLLKDIGKPLKTPKTKPATQVNEYNFEANPPMLGIWKEPISLPTPANPYVPLAVKETWSMKFNGGHTYKGY